MMRWGIRVVASIVGTLALLGVAYAVNKYARHDPVREMFREGVDASRAIREQLGRDCNLRVERASGTEDQVVVRVSYPDPPTQAAEQRELIRNTNMVVRRIVHRVQEVKVLFEDEPAPIPSWDGGVAVAGAPVPVGVDIPPAIPGTPQPARIGVAPIAAPDAGAPAGPKPAGRASTKSGTVTLVTFPEADVFRGKEKLGRTPMFNAELPAGTHLLTLVGDDGARHRLSLPVKQGKNKPLKMNLADLPTK